MRKWNLPITGPSPTAAECKTPESGSQAWTESERSKSSWMCILGLHEQNESVLHSSVLLTPQPPSHGTKTELGPMFLFTWHLWCISLKHFIPLAGVLRHHPLVSAGSTTVHHIPGTAFTRAILVFLRAEYCKVSVAKNLPGAMLITHCMASSHREHTDKMRACFFPSNSFWGSWQVPWMSSEVGPEAPSSATLWHSELRCVFPVLQQGTSKLGNCSALQKGAWSLQAYFRSFWLQAHLPEPSVHPVTAVRCHCLGNI